MSTQCWAPSAPPVVRLLRFGAGFGCKTVTDFFLRKLSPCSSQAQSVHCQSLCNDRLQNLLQGSKRDCPQENLLSAESRHCAPPPAPAGTRGNVCDSHKFVYTQMHAYKHVRCGYLAANGVISKGQCIKWIPCGAHCFTRSYTSNN